VTGTIGGGQARLGLEVGNGQIAIDTPAANAVSTTQ
jgi:hypothetical protein